MLLPHIQHTQLEFVHEYSDTPLHLFSVLDNISRALHSKKGKEESKVLILYV